VVESGGPAVPEGRPGRASDKKPRHVRTLAHGRHRYIDRIRANTGLFSLAVRYMTRRERCGAAFSCQHARRKDRAATWRGFLSLRDRPSCRGGRATLAVVAAQLAAVLMVTDVLHSARQPPGLQKRFDRISRVDLAR